MRTLSIFCAALLSCLAPAPARANFIPPMPLQLQVQAADLVVVARLGERTTCSVERQPMACAEILADAVLKGPTGLQPFRRYLILSSSIDEMDLSTREFPGTNLVFLERVSREGSVDGQPNAEFYTPVRSFRSILPVDESGNR